MTLIIQVKRTGKSVHIALYDSRL